MADELFTCRVREHHIGKRFEDVREEDLDFVRWVLLQVDIRNHNLRRLHSTVRQRTTRSVR